MRIPEMYAIAIKTVVIPGDQLNLIQFSKAYK